MSRFLQIHTLTSYPASLLNRDDVGFAKRIPFGGSERVRISSQCLKRHWRTADSEHALSEIPLESGSVPMAVRSRRSFEKRVHEPLVEAGAPTEVAEIATEAVLKWVLPEGAKKQAASSGGGDEEGDEGKAATFRTGQVTVLGEPELRYLRTLADRIVEAAGGDPAEAKAAAKTVLNSEEKKNLQAMKLGAGLDAAVFGRMTTGDILARCDAAIHVAHAFTVHPGFFETDYFSAVDDLLDAEETGSGHINTTELTSGLYYTYLVVDVPQLLANLGGGQEDWNDTARQLAGEVVRRLIHLVATVSPGAKVGSTAPYAHSLVVLAEAGSSQPRTLANAFLEAVPGNRGSLLGSTCTALGKHIADLDQMYGSTVERRLASVETCDALAATTPERVSLPDLAEWAAERAREGA